MSGFGKGYQVGLNAARSRQVSAAFWSAVTGRGHRDGVQAQFLQAQLAAQAENLRLRHENAELRFYSDWACAQIDRMDEYNANLARMLDVRDTE